MPFGNSVDTFELRGDRLKEVFERAVKDEPKETKVFPRFVVQVSGWCCAIEAYYIYTIIITQIISSSSLYFL